MRAPTASAQRLPRAERERGILDAADAEFDAHGFHGASMQQIAARSGITKALVYQYFDSKEGLYTACVERGRAQMFGRIERAAGEADPGEVLAVTIATYFDELHASRNRSYVLYGDAPVGAINEMRRRNAAVVTRLLRRDGALREADTELVAQLIVGAGEQVGRWWLEQRGLPADLVKTRFTLAIAGTIASLARR
jgi:AcrR family transcriptional regulator